MASIFSFSKDLRIRYMTLISTIKTASSTFYDAYNNFMEELLKDLANMNKIVYPAKASITTLLDTLDFRQMLASELKIDFSLQNKLKNYALKINKHKHSLEKCIELDNVINYMTLLYEIVESVNKSYHFKSWHIKADEYIVSIYNQQAREVTNLKKGLINSSTLNQKKTVSILSLYNANPKKIVSRLNLKLFIIVKVLIIVLFSFVVILNACDIAINYQSYPGYCQLLMIALLVYAIPFIYLLLRMVRSPKYLEFNSCLKRKFNPFFLNRLGFYYNSRYFSIKYFFAESLGILLQLGFMFMAIGTRNSAFVYLSSLCIVLEVIIYQLLKYFFYSYNITIIYLEDKEIYLDPESGLYQIKVVSK